LATLSTLFFSSFEPKTYVRPCLGRRGREIIQIRRKPSVPLDQSPYACLPNAFNPFSSFFFRYRKFAVRSTRRKYCAGIEFKKTKPAIVLTIHSSSSLSKSNHLEDSVRLRMWYCDFSSSFPSVQQTPALLGRMALSPQRRDDNDNVRTNERVLSWLPSADTGYEVLGNDLWEHLRVKRARQPRDSRSGYRNWGSDYMASIAHQQSCCDAPGLTVLTPTVFGPYNDLDGTPWTDSEKWVPNSRSVYAKRKTAIPFDPKPRDACQPYKAKSNRLLKKCNVKEPGASSGKLSLAPLRVVWSYLTEIDHVIGLDEGQTDKVYLECRRLKSLLHTIAACCDQEPMHE
jgi:hypothetical protein